MSHEPQVKPLPEAVAALLPEVCSWLSHQQWIPSPSNSNLRILQCTDFPQCVQRFADLVDQTIGKGKGHAQLALVKFDAPVKLDPVPSTVQETTRLLQHDNAVTQLTAGSDEMPFCSFCAALGFHKLGLSIVSRNNTGLAVVNVSDLVTRLAAQSLESIAENARTCGICQEIVHRSWLNSINTGNIHPSADLQYIYMESRLSGGLEEDSDRLYLLTQLTVELQETNLKSETENQVLQKMRFQRCSTDRSILFCDPTTLFNPEIDKSHLLEGRIRPPVVQKYLIRAWKEHCLDSHQQCRENSETVQPLYHLRLIDVGKKCIIDSLGSESYVALSYVWGHSNRLVITKDNIRNYRVPGSLQGAVSTTIDDAIFFTEFLGERYLWVDCLCILQDCQQDKLIHIPQMGSIYNHALLTIICASGVDAEAGLPGVRPSTRMLDPVICDFGDSPFMMTLDPIHCQKRDCMSGSFWSTRAWTFQERLLSRRVLVFTPSLVYWDCQIASWCEDTFQESVICNPVSPQSTYGDTAFWDHHRLSRVLKAQPFDFMKVYRQVTSHYTQLQLSFQEDGINAITGILNYLGNSNGMKFLWGLPIQYLSFALAWETYSDGGNESAAQHRRRHADHTFAAEAGAPRACRFPSWTWAGWEGKIWYPSDENTASDHSELVFYYVTWGEPPRLLSAVEQRGRESISFSKSLGWKVSGETVLKEADIPSNTPYRPFSTDLLAFWTDTAWVNLHWGEIEWTWRSYHYNSKVEARICAGDTSILSRWSQIPAGTKPNSEERAFLAVIGAKQVHSLGSTTNKPRRHLNIILLNMDGGVACRRGLCELEESDWILLPVRQWRPVFLA